MFNFSASKFKLIFVYIPKTITILMFYNERITLEMWKSEKKEKQEKQTNKRQIHTVTTLAVFFTGGGTQI